MCGDSAARAQGSPHSPVQSLESSLRGSCMTAKGFHGDAEMDGCYLLNY